MQNLNLDATTAKRYGISAVITFVAGFALVVTPELNALTVDTLQSGTLVGMILTGVRAGLKAVAELYLRS